MKPVLLLGLSLVTPAIAQVQSVELGTAHMSFGPAGDHDGDGVGDFYLGTVIYSGADLLPLADAATTVPGALAATVLNDWNDDGTPDFVVADFGVFFKVVSGKPAGGVLLKDNLTEVVVDVSNAGDLDGDGRDDILVHGGGAFCAGAGLGVLVNGGTVEHFFGDNYAAYWGATCVGDLDGDGDDEFAVVYGDYGQVDVDVYDDGATYMGSLPLAANASPYGIHNPSRFGDLNGDGKDDVALSSQGDSDHTRILSGADLATVLLDLPFAPQLAGPGDVNCDGRPDLLRAWPTFGQDAGRVELVSGADGSVLWSAQGAPGDKLGLRLAAGGDLNGDGARDWMVGALSYTRIYYADPPTIASYCTGKVTSAGCTPFVDTSGAPTASGPDDFLVLTREALAQKPGLFFFGTSGPINVPFLGGTLCVSPPLERTPVQLSLGAADCLAGYVFHFSQAHAANEGIAPGDTVHGQFWMRDPQNVDGTGVALTDAVEFDWCP